MLVPGNSIEVRLKDERTKSTNAQPVLLRNLGVMLVPREEFGAANPVGIQPPKSPEDETILFTNVLPGSYWVRAGETPWGYMAAVSSDGNDLSRQQLVVGFGAATPPIEITIRDDGAQVDGNVENWRKEGAARGDSHLLAERASRRCFSPDCRQHGAIPPDVDIS